MRSLLVAAALVAALPATAGEPLPQQLDLLWAACPQVKQLRFDEEGRFQGGTFDATSSTKAETEACIVRALHRLSHEPFPVSGPKEATTVTQKNGRIVLQ